MSSSRIADAGAPSWRRRTGATLTAVAALFLLFDSTGKLFEVAPVIAGTTGLGYPATLVRPLGAVLLACVVLYVVPRTALLGAVLLTGYLGGAVASHVRVGSPLLTHVLFPVYVATMAWVGLVLLDARLWQLARQPASIASPPKE